MENCIFCRIASGEIPSATVLETPEVRVIADIAPAAFGHMLVLPKIHAADVTELPEEYVAAAAKAAKRVAMALQKALQPDGINILQNNGEAAGQTVPHYHVHVIPRRKGDSFRAGWDPIENEGEKVTAAAMAVRARLEAEKEAEA